MHFSWFLFSVAATASNLVLTVSHQPNSNIYQTLTGLDHLLFPHHGHVLDLIEESVRNENINISSSCRQSLNSLRNGLQLKQLWAYRFVDAMGKPNDGILRGRYSSLGNYDECLALTSLPDEKSFNGKYCLLKLNILDKREMIKTTNVWTTPTNHSFFEVFTNDKTFFEFDSFNLGVCIPSTCEEEEILEIVNQKLRQLNFEATGRSFCDTLDKTEEYTLVDIIALSLVIVSSILVIYATLSDNIHLSYFNASKNTAKLFAEPKDYSSKRLYGLHGARFYYLAISICFHIWVVPYAWVAPLYSGILFYRIPWGSKLWIMEEVGANGLLLPEGMIMMSGFLTLYSWYPTLVAKKGNLPLSQYILVRWIRTMPTVVAVMLLTFLYTRFGSGPFFSEVAHKVTSTCYRDWWKILLFVNNWQDTGTEMCMPQTWYLGADFQLYLLSFFIIKLIYKSPKLGFLTALLISVLSMIYAGFTVYVHNLPPYLDATGFSFNTTTDITYLYLPTYVHIPSYMLGIFLAYLVLQGKAPKSKLTWILGWILTGSLFLVTLYLPHLWKSGALIPNRLHQLLYTTTFRIAYISIFVWGLYSFAFQSGGWLQKFFEFPIYAPISRMSLSIVTAQFVIIFYDMGSRRQPILFETYHLLMLGLRTIALCFLFGYAVYLLFEAPMANLATAALKRQTKERRAEEEEEEAKDHNLNHINNNNDHSKLSEDSKKKGLTRNGLTKKDL